MHQNSAAWTINLTDSFIIAGLNNVPLLILSLIVVIKQDININ